MIGDSSDTRPCSHTRSGPYAEVRQVVVSFRQAFGSLDWNRLAAETTDQRPQRFRNFLRSVLSWSAHRYILQATHHDAQL